MNIQDAKDEIIHTLRAYLRRDSTGAYCFPTVRQRPILLIGPPGIGKTAIMEQVARECEVALVAYTITHHTRQSAIGLPHIEQRVYGGVSMSVTEYTMSEIIASVYETMERTGKREGILFLDEINCVSETLAPTMLQFLQNKTFGSHRVPEGWVIVAAGNPPEYNKSVREFDIVTLDRVRQIFVTADVDIWLDYARAKGLHGAILSYLSAKKDRFYTVEREGDAVRFVTARGWEDLSEILCGYEALQIPVTRELIAQYLCEEGTAREFAACYTLFQKYHADYAVDELLCHDVDEDSYRERVAMAGAGLFDERVTVVNLILSCLQNELAQYAWEDAVTVRLHELLCRFHTMAQTLEEYVALNRRSLAVKRENSLISDGEARREERVLARLEELGLAVKAAHLRDREEAWELLRTLFREDVARRSAATVRVQTMLTRAFRFVEDSFGDGAEMLLLVSGLSRMPDALSFIRRHGCASYLRHGQALLYRERERELQAACRELL